MITKKEILAKINEAILEEKGQKVGMASLFTDAMLDSLGTMVALITIDSEFNIFRTDKPGHDISDIDFETFTIRELVIKCILSITDTLKAK